METVRVLQLDRREALSNDYTRSYKRLKIAVKDFLQVNDKDGEITNLIERVTLADDHGLCEWCFMRAGQDDPPFCTLRDNYPSYWSELLRMMLPTYPK